MTLFRASAVGFALSLSASASAGPILGVSVEGHTDLANKPSCLTDAESGEAVDVGEIWNRFQVVPNSANEQVFDPTPGPSNGSCKGGAFRPAGLLRVHLRLPQNDKMSWVVEAFGGAYMHVGLVEWDANAQIPDTYQAVGLDGLTDQRVRSEGHTAWLVGGGLSLGAERTFGRSGAKPFVGAGMDVFVGTRGNSLGGRGKLRPNQPFDWTDDAKDQCKSDAGEGENIYQNAQTVSLLCGAAGNEAGGLAALLGGHLGGGVRFGESFPLFIEGRYSMMAVGDMTPKNYEGTSFVLPKFLLNPVAIRVGFEFEL